MADRPSTLVSQTTRPGTGANDSAPVRGTGCWLDAMLWLATAAMGSMAITQAVGITGISVVYVMQALTPFVLTMAVPLAVGAMLTQRHGLAVTNAGIALALLALCAPIVLSDHPPRIADDAQRVRIAHANAYFKNATPAAAADRLLEIDADVLAVTEYDTDLATALAAAGVSARYPFRIDRAPTDRNGVALFSRFPITTGVLEPIGGQYGIDATIDLAAGSGAGGSIRIIAVHPLPGINRVALRQLRRDLAEFGRRATTPGPPTVMVGDFNASRWHPAFRDLLGRGLIDAHEQLGDGFSRSWPNGWWIPRFVRLDHALLGEGVTAVRIDDVAVPGSDHLGFVVEVAIMGP